MGAFKKLIPLECRFFMRVWSIKISLLLFINLNEKKTISGDGNLCQPIVLVSEAVREAIFAVINEV